MLMLSSEMVWEVCWHRSQNRVFKVLAHIFITQLCIFHMRHQFKSEDLSSNIRRPILKFTSILHIPRRLFDCFRSSRMGLNCNLIHVIINRNYKCYDFQASNYLCNFQQWLRIWTLWTCLRQNLSMLSKTCWELNWFIQFHCVFVFNFDCLEWRFK